MRRVFSLGAIIAAFATAAIPLQAKTIRCPQRNSLFRVTIPDSWTFSWDRDGSLTCMPRNQSKYVSVVPSENVRSKGELGAQLTKTARDAARNARFKDLRLGAIKESTRSGMSLMSITAEGTTRGRQMVFTLVAFAPKKDNYFTLLALEPVGARDKEVSAIINSVSTLR